MIPVVTIEGCETSQFAQLVRAVAGLPFGGTGATGHWWMENTLGEDMEKLDSVEEDGDTFVHLYGKAEARPGRKMAHINRRIAN